MTHRRAAALAALTVWCAASGCTTLQEIPRADYTTIPRRNDISVLTRDSLSYEFDYATFTSDSMIGYRRLDVSGAVPEYATFGLPLDDVERLSSRRLDMYRTTLIGGAGLLAVIGAGLAKNANDNRAGGESGGGGGGRVP